MKLGDAIDLQIGDVDIVRAYLNGVQVWPRSGQCGWWTADWLGSSTIAQIDNAPDGNWRGAEVEGSATFGDVTFSIAPVYKNEGDSVGMDTYYEASCDSGWYTVTVENFSNCDQVAVAIHPDGLSDMFDASTYTTIYYLNSGDTSGTFALDASGPVVRFAIWLHVIDDDGPATADVTLCCAPPS